MRSSRAGRESWAVWVLAGLAVIAVVALALTVLRSPDGSPNVLGTQAPRSEPTPSGSTRPLRWQTRSFALDDGRTYVARVPVCPSATSPCATQRRQVALFAHGFNAREDRAATDALLASFARVRPQDDTIFVYGVSRDGLRAWHAGICCTFEADQPDDVGYLVDVARDLAHRTAIDPQRIGIFGWSNGGMLALKAECDRPDVFALGSSWAGTYVGPCGKKGVVIMQMHGGADTTVPVHGGRTFTAGHWWTVPPASDLRKRLAPGVTFPITIYPGIDHEPPGPLQAEQLHWVFDHLAS